jgi:hypothetical protein
VESPGLLVAQGDGGAIDSDLERIPAERTAQESELRPLDETEHHQALDGGIGGLDRLDASAITGL